MASNIGVQGLGQFIELEVALRPHRDPEEGVATARGLMTALGIDTSDRIDAAYVDLLE